MNTLKDIQRYLHEHRIVGRMIPFNGDLPYQQLPLVKSSDQFALKGESQSNLHYLDLAFLSSQVMTGHCVEESKYFSWLTASTHTLQVNQESKSIINLQACIYQVAPGLHGPMGDEHIFSMVCGHDHISWSYLWSSGPYHEVDPEFPAGDQPDVVAQQMGIVDADKLHIPLEGLAKIAHKLAS